MAVTCGDILNLELDKRLKLMAGEKGLNNVIRWPFIKNMDTIGEWIHGGELIFVMGVKEDTSEKGLITTMKEALKNNVSGVVILCGEKYIRTIPKGVIAFANENNMPLFKMPFVLKLIDITQEICQYILADQELYQRKVSIETEGLIDLLLQNKRKTEILDYCYSKLQPLIEADRVLNTEYVMTLQQYLENNNELVETSRKMFIHRNTLVNRIRKIEALLGYSVNEREARVDLNNVYSVLNLYGKLDWK